MKIKYYPLLLTGILLISCGNYADKANSNTYQPPDLPKKDIVDIHFHAACASEKFGCFVSPQAKKKLFGLKYSAYLKSFGITREDVDNQKDSEVFRKASQLVENSRYVSKAIVLAMDGIYDEQGVLDKRLTQVYFPNAYVAEQVARYDNLLFGASINPDRKNAIEDLVKAKEMGALLIKWLPCTMYFDPADPKYTEFYRTLVRLKLPLLSHVGKESSIDNSRDELCDPMRLELALKLGVTVIAAHMGSRGEYQGEPAYQRLQTLMKLYPNLYADNSATLMRNRPVEFLIDSDAGNRVLYGSDYPVLNVSILGYALQILDRFDRYLSEDWKIYIHSELTNILDKDVAVKKAMGVPDSSFYLYRELFQIPESIPDTGNVD